MKVIGGGIRVPSVQEKLRQALGGRELDKHLNGDEAAVYGTVSALIIL